MKELLLRHAHLHFMDITYVVLIEVKKICIYYLFTNFFPLMMTRPLVLAGTLTPCRL